MSSPSGDGPLGLRHLGPGRGHRGQSSLRGLVSRPDVVDPGPHPACPGLGQGGARGQTWASEPVLAGGPVVLAPWAPRLGVAAGPVVLSPSQRGACVSAGPADVLAHLSCPSFKVTGRAALQSTTLQSLGLTGGSAIIRWGLWSLSGERNGASKERKRGAWERGREHEPHGPRPLRRGHCLGFACLRGGTELARQAGLCPLRGRTRTPLRQGRTGRGMRTCRGLDSGGNAALRPVYGVPSFWPPQICHEAM